MSEWSYQVHSVAELSMLNCSHELAYMFKLQLLQMKVTYPSMDMLVIPWIQWK